MTKLRIEAQEAVIPAHYYMVTMSFNYLSQELIYKEEGTDLSQLLEKTSNMLRSDEMRQKYEQGLAKLKRSYGWENQDPDIFTELSFYIYEVTEDKEDIILQTGYNLKSSNYDYDAIVERIDSEAIVPFLDNPEYREESKKRIDNPSNSKPKIPNATPTNSRPESYAYDPRDFNARRRGIIMAKLRIEAQEGTPMALLIDLTSFLENWKTSLGFMVSQPTEEWEMFLEKVEDIENDAQMLANQMSSQG
jgi:hypothetical protein